MYSDKLATENIERQAVEMKKYNMRPSYGKMIAVNWNNNESSNNNFCLRHGKIFVENTEIKRIMRFRVNASLPQPNKEMVRNTSTRLGYHVIKLG